MHHESDPCQPIPVQDDLENINPFISIRITSLDYYLTEPHPSLDSLYLQFSQSTPGPYQKWNVPILRLFGTTPLGQKTCLHLHQVYPYFYIRYHGPEDPNARAEYIHQLGVSINHAVEISFGRTPSSDPSKQHVASIVLIKGIPFYGFHPTNEPFLKIYILNPGIQSRIVGLLESGTILGRVFETYESHIPYLLQFLVDHNLYGMDYLHLSYGKFRRPILNIERRLHEFSKEIKYPSPAQDKFGLFTNTSIPAECFWALNAKVKRISYCEIEVDGWISDILNRNDIRPRLSEPLFSKERLKRGKKELGTRTESLLVPSLMNIWEEENARRKRRFLPDNRNGDSQGESNRYPYSPWYNEPRLRERFQNVIRDSLQNAAADTDPEGIDTSFVLNYKKETPFLASLPTAFEAISWLHPPSRKFEFSAGPDGQVLAKTVPLSRAGTPSNVDGVSFEEHSMFLSQRTYHPNSGETRAYVDEGRILTVASQQSSIPIEETEDILNWMAREEDAEQLQDIEPGAEDDKEFSDGFDMELEIDVTDPIGVSPAKPVRALSQTIELSRSSALKYSRSTSDITNTPRSPTASRSIKDKSRLRHRDNDGDEQILLSDDSGNIPQYDGADGDLESSRNIKSTKASHSKKRRKSRVSKKARNPLPKNPDKRLELLVQDCNVQSFLNWKGMSLSSPTHGEVPCDLPEYHIQVQSPTAPSREAAVESLEPTFEYPDVDNIPMNKESVISPPPTKEETVPKPRSASTIYKFGVAPPSSTYLVNSLVSHDLPEVVYQEPFFSKKSDVPSRPRLYGGREFRLKGNDVEFLPEFDTSATLKKSWSQDTYDGNDREPYSKTLERLKRYLPREERKRSVQHGKNGILWTVPHAPPSRSSIDAWLNLNPVETKNPARDNSQIQGPTQANPFGFKYSQIQLSQKQDETKELGLSLLSVEIHVSTMGGKLPDPSKDPIQCVFYVLQHEEPWRFPSNGRRPGFYVGMIAVKDSFPKYKTATQGYRVDVVDSEEFLLKSLIKLVRGWDPDILLGYEIHQSSWGYIVERAENNYNVDFLEEIARVIPEHAKATHGRDGDEWGFKKQSSIHTSGRIFLNIWRLMRRELTLVSYSLENVVFHVLHRRIPKISQASLSEWWNHGMLLRWRTMNYYFDRVQCNLELLDDTEFINRTSEFARVYGIDFFSVIIRGSQFKVESVMARIARPEGFIMYSPSRERVAKMKALECIPLIMEPKSEFYTSPVLVLDFQSLYPSMMIAYNYCFSTLLGRVATVGEKAPLGSLEEYVMPPQLVDLLKDHVNVAPNGAVFVKPHIRKGVLGRMLTEILDTRVMVKKSMKLYQGDKSLLRVLDAKQLSLKLLANVTYGYTSASFSGRMPCVEIADAIVQSGRATLEKAIEMIHGNPSWGARVVYGDTDSLFVHLEGISKDRAFQIGNEIVDSVTKVNPEPVKLKFEKVYLPSVLLAKKRYVGFMYETLTVKEPVFDAKGIETVRRDGCPAVAKTMESTLKLLFRTKDLSLVKQYLFKCWGSIHSGNVAIQDFIIAKEVKLGTYSENGTLPPGAHLSVKKLGQDKRAEPQYGERVPYVVVHGSPKHRLIDSVVSPEELARTPSLRLHGTYYITKQIIPALARIFNLIGVDLMKWYSEMPKVHKAIVYTSSQQVQSETRNIQAVSLDDFENNGSNKAAGLLSRYANNVSMGRTIDQYYLSGHCFICNVVCNKDLCDDCSSPENIPNSLYQLSLRVKHAETRYKHILEICRSCTGLATSLDADIPCESLDCPVFYSRLKAQYHVRLGSKWRRVMDSMQEPLFEVRQDEWIQALEF